eukprot:scaffold140942_cov30-Tisochrysis_lutea.AAC.6
MREAGCGSQLPLNGRAGEKHSHRAGEPTHAPSKPHRRGHRLSGTSPGIGGWTALPEERRVVNDRLASGAGATAPDGSSTSRLNHVRLGGAGITAVCTGVPPVTMRDATTHCAACGASSSAPTLWSAPLSSAHTSGSCCGAAQGNPKNRRFLIEASCATHSQVRGPSDPMECGTLTLWRFGCGCVGVVVRARGRLLVGDLSFASQLWVRVVGERGWVRMEHDGRERDSHEGPLRVRGHVHKERRGSHVPP